MLVTNNHKLIITDNDNVNDIDTADDDNDDGDKKAREDVYCFSEV